MAGKDYKAFIVEGKNREPIIINNILKIFFKHSNFKIITLPAEENIYMLWSKLKDDDFETDVIEVLRERNEKNRALLEELSRDDFAEIYLFFDYDLHQNNLRKDVTGDVLEQMLQTFDNETEVGKLYISYPMSEALRDYTPRICGIKGKCYVSIEDMHKYKGESALHSPNSQFEKFTIENWIDIIDVFAMKVSCLFGAKRTIEYEQYLKELSTFEIYDKERQKSMEKGVFILSAFPEFLVDYFGSKIWTKCVKHGKKRLSGIDCD